MIKKLLLVFPALFVLSLAYTSAIAFAQETTQAPPPSIADQSIADSVCQGVLGTQDPSIDTNTTIADCRESGDKTFNAVIQRIINIFSIVVGAVSVIMIIIGGFRYIISGGDSTGVSGAKNTILYAIVGLVIVLFSQVLVRFVIANLTPTPATSSSQTTQSSQQAN